MMLDNLSSYELILASASPRRKELLQGLGLPFTIRVIDGIDEAFPETLQGEDVALFVARQKAAAYRQSMKENELIITADTIVCLGERVFGKPGSEEEAIQMLSALSGRTHQVATGVTINTATQQRGFVVTSNVTFSVLTQAEIAYYVQECKPLDKAGAYGIQEWIGFIGIERIEGSFYNVMGLPVQRLYRELKRIQ